MRYSAFLLCLLLAAACDDNLTGPTVPLNQQFELVPTQTATVEGESVSIRFDRVSNDSRCPTDAVCVQGGDAIVHIEVFGPGAFRRTPYELHTGDMRPVKHEDLTIELVQLAPYPFSSQTIPQEDYRATLRVTR